MNRKAFAIVGGLLFGATAVFVSAAAAPAQGRGGVHGGAVGGSHPGGLSPALPPVASVLNPATRPLAPHNVPAQQFGSPPVNAYRPNGGYIPFVGYYLPEAAPYTRPSASGIGSYRGESLADEFPVQPAPPQRVIPIEQPEAAARVTVRLPAGAELWFGGTKVPSAGAVREFKTPVLRPGRLYDYEVRARWSHGGRSVTQSEQVVISAGAAVRIDFTKPAGTAP